jgi:hypothetical protein
MLMVRKIVPLVLSFLTGDDYTDLWESSWMCTHCIYMNDEESPRLSLVILMKGHEYVLCAVPIDNSK